MGFAAQISRWDRWRERQEVCLRGLVEYNGKWSEIEIEDLSDAGCGGTVRTVLRTGSYVKITAPRIGTRLAQVTRKSGARYGFAFETPSPISRGAQLRLVEPAVHEQTVDLEQRKPSAKLPGRERFVTVIGSSAVLWTGIALVLRHFAF